MVHQVKGHQRVQRFKKVRPRLTTRDMLYIVTQHYTHINTHTHTHTHTQKIKFLRNYIYNVLYLFIK